eukprot:8550344-Alexandrium_andersonii.AAC.1
MAGSSFGSSTISSPTDSQRMVLRMMASHFSGWGISGSAAFTARFRLLVAVGAAPGPSPCGPPAAG